LPEFVEAIDNVTKRGRRKPSLHTQVVGHGPPSELEAYNSVFPRIPLQAARGKRAAKSVLCEDREACL
jgi:hypothetical protein